MKKEIVRLTERYCPFCDNMHVMAQVKVTSETGDETFYWQCLRTGNSFLTSREMERNGNKLG